jgi:hypothetical protein
MNECWREGVACTSHNVFDHIVDQTSVQSTSASPQNSNGDIASGNINLSATLSSDSDGAGTNNRGTCYDSNGNYGTPSITNPHCATWCSKQAGLCGNDLQILNMINTYDELHLRQFGTIQEIWVQLMYAYNHYTKIDGSNAPTDGFESPFPNVFFSAPQVHSVSGACSDAYGKCSGYTRAMNLPYAGSDSDADRWVTDADGLGGARGESFWPDDFDARK